MDSDLVWGAVLAAFLAGTVIVLVSLLINFLGGTIGAILGTIPHIIVVGSIGFLSQTETHHDFKVACLSMVVGIFLSSWFLLAMRGFAILVLSKDRVVGSTHRLWVTLAVGLAAFLSLMSVMVFGLLRNVEEDISAVWAVALTCFVIQFAAGLYYLFTLPPVAKSNKKASAKTIAFRFTCTFCVMTVAMLVARAFPILAGVLGTLPITSAVVFVALWTQFSEAVALEASMNMIGGMCSASLYALFATELLIALPTAAGAVVSFLAAVLCITLPMLLVSNWRRKRYEQTQADETDKKGDPSTSGVDVDIDEVALEQANEPILVQQSA